MKGQRILRKSLKTRDAARANARMARLIEACTDALKENSDECEVQQSDDVTVASPIPMALPTPVPMQVPLITSDDDPAIIGNAIKAFLENCTTNGVKASTIRKYRNSLNHLTAFANSKDIRLVRDLKVIHLDGFRASRKLSPISSQKELETCRAFFSYSVARDLCEENIAQKVKGPRNLSPNDVEPYTPEEVDRIIAATQEFGRNQYERVRAKAIILVLRYTALRISDVAILRRDRIRMQNGRWVIFVRAAKNKELVFLPIPRQMKEALDAVPKPWKAAPGCPYYFWSGDSNLKSIAGVIGECVSAVFKKSGVARAHAHRFRHTLATELLGQGGSFEAVADVLGDSVEVVKRHYAKWSSARQAQVTDLMIRVHGDADWSEYPEETGKTG